MSRPDTVVDWCLGIATALAEAADTVGRLTDAIARDWPDDRGVGRAERTALLHRELVRDAVAASELGSALREEYVVLPAAGIGAGRARGARLGGTDADRVDDERGMRIAQLPPG